MIIFKILPLWYPKDYLISNRYIFTMQFLNFRFHGFFDHGQKILKKNTDLLVFSFFFLLSQKNTFVISFCINFFSFVIFYYVKKIIFFLFSPNSTHIYQPLDVAFCRRVKNQWDKILKTKNHQSSL